MKRSLIPFRMNERENGNKDRRYRELSFIVIQETTGRRVIARRKLTRNEANQIGRLRNTKSFTISCNRLDEVSKVKRLPHFLFPVLSCAYLHRFCVTSIAMVTLLQRVTDSKYNLEYTYFSTCNNFSYLIVYRTRNWT